MIAHVSFILGVFVVFFLLLLIYDIASLYQIKNEKALEEKRKQKLINIIKKKEQAKDSKKNQKLVNKLKKLSYLHTFSIMLEEHTMIDEKPLEKIVSKSSYDGVFISLALIYQKKDHLSKAYYAYLLHFVPIDQPEIIEFLHKALLSKSIYCIENALLAFCYLKDSDKVIDAYLLMSREQVLYEYKLVADGLAHFQGSKKVLCKKLYQHFDQFTEPLKIGFLIFFRQCKYDVSEELLERLIDGGMEKEVEIEIIRYFSKVLCDKVTTILLERLETNYYNDFEYDVVMIQTLANYPGAKTIKVLKKSLSDYNYYVRYNAAKSLSKMTDLKKIKGLTDPFAIEMVNSLISQDV